MLVGLLSQSYDVRKPSVFVDFPVMDFVSFNSKLQALLLEFAYSCGSPLNENDQDTTQSTGCWTCLEVAAELQGQACDNLSLQRVQQGYVHTTRLRLGGARRRHYGAA